MSTGRNPSWGPRNKRSLVLNVLRVLSSSVFPNGSWTPTLIGETTAGTQTYTEQYGRYMAVGNWVLIEGRVILSAKGGTMDGNVLIGGLPVTVASSGVLSGAVSPLIYDSINLSAGYSQLGIVSKPATTNLQLYESGDNVNGAAVVAAAISNTTAIVFGGWYRAS